MPTALQPVQTCSWAGEIIHESDWLFGRLTARDPSVSGPYEPSGKDVSSNPEST